MKLSIITVNKNNDSSFETTALSVISQKFIDFEWIVIDGASNDKSIDIIKKYAYKMNYWVSESDNGIYHAMNKGISRATGEYCLFLNSGDWFFSPDSLEKAFNIIEKSEYADIYYGNCLTNEYLLWKMPNPLTIDSLFNQTALSHQNTFIKRTLFYEHEFYNENFPTVSDSIFFIKEFWLYKSKFLYIDMVISVYSWYGISYSYNSSRQEFLNEIKIFFNPRDYNKLIIRNIKIKRYNFFKRIIKYFLPHGIILFLKNHIDDKYK